MKKQNSSGFAVLCDLSGKIKSVLFEGFEKKFIHQDSLLIDYIDSDSRQKFVNFKIALNMNKTIVDWQINILYNNYVQTMVVAGSISDEGMLILFGYSADGVIKICDILAENNFKGVDIIRKMIDDDQNSTMETQFNPDSMYDELSRLNNELISLQRELAKKNVELDLRVKERTSQLEDTNLELEGFLYSVSHQLRAPLRGINGWSQALNEDYKDKLDETGIIYLERVQNESLLMARLIDDFQLFSNISRKELQIERVDLTEFAKQIGLKLKQQVPDREITFSCEPGLEDWGDKPLLRMALEQLISNAIKFSKPTEKAVIQVGKTLIKETPTYFVQDNGIGFKMEIAQNLFGAFFQFQDPAVFPGNGIGLTIVKRIVHKHGGQIWAESKVNQGAIFYFTLNAKNSFSFPA